MARGGMKLFFVCVHNNTDCRDDDVIKVRARTKGNALRLVAESLRPGKTLGRVYTHKGLKRFDPEWHALLWGVEPQYEEKVS